MLAEPGRLCGRGCRCGRRGIASAIFLGDGLGDGAFTFGIKPGRSLIDVAAVAKGFAAQLAQLFDGAFAKLNRTIDVRLSIIMRRIAVIGIEDSASVDFTGALIFAKVTQPT